MTANRYISARYGIDQSWTLSQAERNGAYEGAKKALLQMSPAEIEDEAKKASFADEVALGFRRRKRGFLNPQPGEEVYLVVNGDESSLAHSRIARSWISIRID
ncbi:MAG: hypothetical protein R3A47_04735 [Polyangiales bacterium]